MVPEGPGKAKLLDLVEAATDPQSLATRILNDPNSDQRQERLKLLAQGWSDPQAAAQWAGQNLTGQDRTTFYSQVGYALAEQNPQAALDILEQMRGTEGFASAFGSMMRGLVQLGGKGQEAAKLIANSDLPGDQRTDLISELARRWVRSDPDAAVAWVNTLTAPQDFQAAIPLLVSQLDNDRVSRTVQSFLSNHDPVMETGLLEAAAPSSLAFDPTKSRLILDPLISSDPSLRIAPAEGDGASRNEMVWNAVTQTAKRQAEIGSPTSALDWLGTLPFASQTDYARAAADVMNVWNLKSPGDAANWLQNSSLDPALKATLAKSAPH
jgi:hypothetical protein